MGTSGFVEREGGRIYFEVDGQGEPLLLIHGGLGNQLVLEFPAAAADRRETFG